MRLCHMQNNENHSVFNLYFSNADVFSCPQERHPAGGIACSASCLDSVDMLCQHLCCHLAGGRECAERQRMAGIPLFSSSEVSF